MSRATALKSKTKACIRAAPKKPPISVCDDDEGIPTTRVNKFKR